MCIIIDTSKYGDYLKEGNVEMAPVYEWLMQPNSKIAYSPTPDFERELGNPKRASKMRNYLNTMSRAGKVKKFNKEKIEAKRKELEVKGILSSNDSHIMALALVANVKVLIAGDKKLCRDFENLAEGSIYRDQNDEHLLTPDLCP